MNEKIIKTFGKALNVLSYIAPKYTSKLALNLFATPRKGSYTESQSKLMDSAIFNMLKYNTLKIAAYYWPGNETAKTILLAHGWESNASRWHYILEHLREEGYNIVVLDAPAHGKSESKHFNAVLYSEFINVVAQRFKPEVLIGHSVGGMACIFCMHNYHLSSVKKLISLGSPAHFTGVFLRYKQLMGYNNRISNGLNTFVLKRFQHPIDYFSAAEFSSNFKIKGLIIHDDEDPIIPYEDAKLLVKNFKDSRLITTKGLGHGLKSTSLTPKIIEFINN